MNERTLFDVEEEETEADESQQEMIEKVDIDRAPRADEFHEAMAQLNYDDRFTEEEIEKIWEKTHEISRLNYIQWETDENIEKYLEED